MQPTLTKEHEWLKQFILDWEYEWDYEDNGKTRKFTGKETVRPVGDAWVVFESRGQFSDGDPDQTVMTIGYDPGRGKFVGSFIGSMLTYLWVYEGQLDETGILRLDAEGPSMSPGGGMANYVDSLEIAGDEKVLSSRIQGKDGEWQEFMRMTYRRRG